jgi:predicted RecB family nuclease
VLGFGVGVQRTIATLRRAYETASAESLVPSAFYDRFSKGLIDFLKECLAHGVADLISHTSLSLSEKLKGFEDLIVADGTVIKLHDKLAKQFPGTRHKAEQQGYKACMALLKLSDADSEINRPVVPKSAVHSFRISPST